ncbi:hypothetical protein ACJIZ3_021257 [Penstemon smallii]|uniref:Arabinogalactan peptide n=1 Tax=Penstemon smallii TaxID=265156 RepID=A0ABD3SLL6_9LAMI
MKMLRLSFVMTIFLLLLALVNAQVPEPAPAPSSDGVAIDQGIAYLLMLVALAITYMLH